MLKFKLDENFAPALAELLNEAGHDAETVLSEELSGEPDDLIFEVCQKENRCVVTLDLGFANILNFPADKSAGIIVVRPDRPIDLTVMQDMIQLLIEALEDQEPSNCLWILEPGRLRIRAPKR